MGSVRSEGTGTGTDSSEAIGRSSDSGRDNLENDEAPIVLHTFSATLLSDARPVRLIQPLRLTQGADLRIENFGDAEVGDGVPSMFIGLTMNGMRISDYGALEEGGAFASLLDGPSAALADGGALVSGSGGEGEYGGGSSGAQGKVRATLAFYCGGRLEIGGNFKSMSLVALPARVLAILDIVLACIMGPPAARKAQEMAALEEQVAEEEEEEALGGGKAGELLAPSARQEALNTVRGGYLYFGRMDARITIRGEGLALLLAQDPGDTSTNVIMAQVKGLFSDFFGPLSLLFLPPVLACHVIEYVLPRTRN